MSIIREAEAFVRSHLKEDGTGHDWYHIDRVRRTALLIAREEQANIQIVELAALLHELPDRKIAGKGNEKKALLKIRQWLVEHSISDADADEILYIIENQSYSASGLRGERLTSLEGRVVQDADRLEALGAIGIARCFAYTGKHARSLYDPLHPPRMHEFSAEEYEQGQMSAVNHFYEKLFKLKDLMNTKTGKRIAEQRHRFMETYLEQFFAEWEGDR